MSKIKCFLCGHDADEYDALDKLRAVWIDCSQCRKYEAGDYVMKFVLRNNKFSQEQKKKLSSYIKKQSDRVTLTTGLVEKVAGFRSVEYR